ncbi:MAG: putative signal transducing protein [Giesbergeria sp.]
MPEQLRFVVVETHTSPWDAHVSRALLASEGISAVLASEHHVWAAWHLSLALGGVRVLVPAEHVPSASEVFALRDQGELQAALLEQLALGLPACLRCGSTKFVEPRNWLSVALSFMLLFTCRVIFPPMNQRKCASCGCSEIGDGQ